MDVAAPQKVAIWCLVFGLGLSTSLFAQDAANPRRPRRGMLRRLTPPVIRLSASDEPSDTSKKSPESSESKAVVDDPNRVYDPSCPIYFRERPMGKRKERLRTMITNRHYEPDWYRFYRHQHFGYHPTQWLPWPENWMQCRRPIPGPHPYDLKQPDPLPYDIGGPDGARPRNSTQAPPLQEPRRLDEPAQKNNP